MMVLESINEGVVVVRNDQSVIMSNVVARSILGEGIEGARVIDLFKNNNDLLEAYWEVANSKANFKEIYDVTFKSEGREMIALDFTCLNMNNKGDIGAVLLLFHLNSVSSC